ncbi:mucoidy inhibitor A [Coprinopsis marcescibilis]|uniref:Mucoidy inhibitor A n=1 Tax=Coprinopsis marcescibilis TaxID=230819 RepID=A0A5C3KQU6_COPMA|nr:mucoidy inhibitor A [Coprinopsis marcescibilis]
MSMEQNQLPAFDSDHRVNLVSTMDSKIISVSVYSGRAEIVRLFKFEVKTGHNKVVVSGLPLAIDQESFRVEGRGSATIHDVTISHAEPPPKPTTSPKLQDLEDEFLKVTKALVRADKALKSLEVYIKSLSSRYTDVTKLQEIVTRYDEAAEKLDDKITVLDAKQKGLDCEVQEEKKVLSGPQPNEKLNLKASIGVFADRSGEVEVALIYAVSNASWVATYDIRVDMAAKDKPVDLIYKGAITQNTGEDWTDVPISLETAAPTFGVNIPRLSTWTLSVYNPAIFAGKNEWRKERKGGKEALPKSVAVGGMPGGGPPPLPGYSLGRMMRRDDSDEEDGSVDDIRHRSLQVSSKGNVTATFTVPGLMSIPSDNAAHSVTIVQLKLDATMEWISVPKREAKVHLKAIVKNKSEYALLAGQASVYVDGSFIARTSLPAVSPEETFDCPLGLDPSIRVTYPPVTKKSTHSGFMTKSRVQNFTQRITIHNTKSSQIESIKILDQVPVSEDSIIGVKLISPALTVAEANSTIAASTRKNGATRNNKNGVTVPGPIRVAQGITVQWDGGEDVVSDEDVRDLGKDGKLYWECTIPAQGRINLSLQWEVSAPFSTNVIGL